jgi:uncharacterized iron-regulated membrane protein
VKAKLRQAVFIVHLWTGLTLGLLTATLGLSGSLLVFRPELDAALYPQLLRVSPVGHARSVGSLTSVVKGAFPKETLQTISMPRSAEGSVEFWMKGSGLRVYVDPYSGKVLGSRHEHDGVFGFLFSLHTKLLMGDDGEKVATATGIALLVLSLSGVVVWWPRGKQKLTDHLRVKTAAGSKRFTYDFHRALGFYASVFLVLSSLTGLSLIWDDVAKSALFGLMGGGKALPKVKAVAGESLPLDQLLVIAEEAMPGGRLSRITLPQKAGDPLNIRKQFGHEKHPNGMSSIALDPATGSVLRKDPDATTSTAQKAMNARYPVHIGLWGGWATRVLHALLGLVPGILFVTGVLMWLRRMKRARRS